MTNRAHWGLRGPVETLRTEFSEWDLTKEEWQARNSNVFHFHRDGRISGSEHHNPNGSISRGPRQEPNAQYYFLIEGTELGYSATDAATMTLRRTRQSHRGDHGAQPP